MWASRSLREKLIRVPMDLKIEKCGFMSAPYIKDGFYGKDNKGRDKRVIRR
jgi:hypothetical protein